MADSVETTEAPPEETLQGGNYEVIRARLEEDARTLGTLANTLNDRRKEIFGGQELVVVGNERIRTEHNCVPRNIVNVQGRLLLGYNVRFALKKQIVVEDVFSLHQFEQTGDGFDLSVTTEGNDFLSDPRFLIDFEELYRYYKDARLQTLRMHQGKLLTVFRIGERPEDIRAFRWEANPGQPLRYIDNRGERDHTFPPSHDFDWVKPSRDDHVLGPHSHINILDKVFVETVGGDLTIKVEDNTDDGQGIYREPVDDAHQSLDDAEIRYAEVGTLILLAMRPFGEEATRYLVFNTRTHDVKRIDAIGQACVSLPEDHGIIFPGGYYLRNGTSKVFDANPQGLIFKKMVKSPNGEDVLFVFHREDTGHYVILPYNLIRQEVASPIHGHGYTMYENGQMVVFRAESDEPTKVHPVQIWDTPFTSAEFAASNPVEGGYLGKVGNADLVRGISDVFAIQRAIANLQPSRQIFEDLVAACSRTLDHYHWIGHASVGGLKEAVDQTRRNAELIIDEFEKLQALQQKAQTALSNVQKDQDRVLLDARPDVCSSVQDFMTGMSALREQRGRLITLQDVRLIDRPALDAMEAKVVEQFDAMSQGCVQFLLGDGALSPILTEIADIEQRLDGIRRALELEPVTEQMDRTGSGLELLIEVIGGLEVGDPNERTSILENISEVFSQLNRVRAVLEGRRKVLLQSEAKAEFAAQFKLLGQGVSSALAMCDTPEKAEEQLSRLMVQLEELEGRFGEFEEYLEDIMVKREEIYEAFESKRQQLLEARQRRVASLHSSGERILEAVGRRAQSFKEPEKLASYFASDSMVLKLRKLSDQLMALGDSVKGEDLLSKLKSARQNALRGLRDRSDLFVGGGNVLQFGRHQFSVNTQPIELTIVPRGDDMAVHLNGTEFYEVITDPDFVATKTYWKQAVISETSAVYRGEYLAAIMLFAAERNEEGLSIAQLEKDHLSEEGLLARVRAFAANRYEEGYERGVHDADAAHILEKVIDLRHTAGLLRYPPVPRAAASLFWAFYDAEADRTAWQRQAQSLARMQKFLPNQTAVERFGTLLVASMKPWLAEYAPSFAADLTDEDLQVAAEYLCEELATERPRFVLGAQAGALVDGLRAVLDSHSARQAFDDDMRALEGRLDARLGLARQWLQGLVRHSEDEGIRKLDFLVEEAAVAMVTDRKLDREVSQAGTTVDVPQLLGQHPLIQDRVLHLRLDEYLDRLRHFVQHRVPGFRAYRAMRHAFVEKERKRLRVDEYKPKVMTTFVRNRLINEVYLPIIGDNLAKQVGSVGEGKRTDTMGMLMLISPPGYGKTTLMEYVASQLGLVFMKVNGPSLGHEVTSLDPSEAPNATARQEVEKINLSFEMGNNVMLYLDDIQHTDPEFLQKFISLCDGTRRIEGIWNNRTRTYDLKGKKFCVVMAGNPYTETGAKFQIPDMLANRADTYNLGDILGGREDLFALSYVENAITSNPALAPLATRDQADIYRLVRMAQGEAVDQTQFSHDYSAGEIQEYVSLLKMMFACRDTLLKVNLEYIRSAAIDDEYRTEPAFKLQGSYRNMSKLAEKLVSALNADEVNRLIEDHYVGESQTLSGGSENNMLKLAEMRGTLSVEQAERWSAIKKDFARNKLMGGGDDDPVARVTGTLAGLGEQIEAIGSALASQPGLTTPLESVQAELAALRNALGDSTHTREALAEVVSGLGQIGTGLEQSSQHARAMPALLTQALQGIGSELTEAIKDLELSTNVEVEQAPVAATDPAVSAAAPAGWMVPHLEVSAEADMVLRHAVLLEVQRALVSYGRMQHTASRQLRAGEYVLAGALPVLHHLVEHVTTLIQTRLPAEKQTEFLDELRRGVARAISDLGEAVGEEVPGAAGQDAPAPVQTAPVRRTSAAPEGPARPDGSARRAVGAKKASVKPTARKPASRNRPPRPPEVQTVTPKPPPKTKPKTRTSAGSKPRLKPEDQG